MKKQSPFLALIVVAAMSTVSCSKKGSAENLPSAANKNIYGRVVEVGTGLPLEGAEFITSTCGRRDAVFGCIQWDKTSSFTGSDGKFSLGNFRNHRLQKVGYWMYKNEPDINCFNVCLNYLPTPITHYTNSSGQLDSILFHLFPVTNITVRVRNTGAQTDASLRTYQYGRSGNLIDLRPGIDSSFQYPVFGNAQNKIFIKRNAFSDTMETRNIYIPKSATLSLDFNY